MTEIDIYIELFKRLGLKQIEEETGRHSNILIYEDNSHKCSIYFNYETGIVSSIRWVEIIKNWSSGVTKDTHDKQSFNQKYRDIIRDIKIKEIL